MKAAGSFSLHMCKNCNISASRVNFAITIVFSSDKNRKNFWQFDNLLHVFGHISLCVCKKDYVHFYVHTSYFLLHILTMPLILAALFSYEQGMFWLSEMIAVVFSYMARKQYFLFPVCLI